MKNTILSIVAVFSTACAAYAEDTVTKTQTPVMGPVISGEVSLDFAETAGDKIGGTMGLDLGVDVSGMATVDLDFSATDGNSVTLDNWTVGTCPSAATATRRPSTTAPSTASCPPPSTACWTPTAICWPSSLPRGRGLPVLA